MRPFSMSSRHQGFTLIELLIVVIIVAIMAAIVVPQFSDSSTEAKEASLDANLAAMRSAVELYKIQHKGKYPGGTSSTSTAAECPSGGGTSTLSATPTSAQMAQALIEQLTMATDENGKACKVASSTYKYGPYLKTKLPSDPFKNKGSVAADIVVTGDGTIPDPAADVGGWKFDTAIGKLIMNSNALDSRGQAYFTR